MNHALSFANTVEHDEMKDWILLDSGSTVNLFSTPKLVDKIKTVDEVMELATNAGTRINTQKADVPDFGEVWYDNKAITNIFALKEMIKRYRVTYDSNVEDAFIIHLPHKVVKFRRSPNGLYYIKPQIVTEVSNLVSTIAENRRNYTIRQFERAKKARKLYHIVGTPTVDNFKALIKMNAIANCPITVEDINIAEKIFGPDISTLKGKST